MPGTVRPGAEALCPHDAICARIAPVRVLHVYHDFSPTRGGIEDYLDDLTRAQAARGWDVVVLSSNARPVQQVDVSDGVRVVRAASFGRYFTPVCPGWFRELPRLAARADVVHLHLPCPLGEWALAFAKARRLVVSLHNDYVRPAAAIRLHRPFHRAALARADAIIASSDEYARSSPALRDWLGKTRIVPYGIDLERYAPSRGAQGASGKRLLSGQRSAPAEPVLFAGRLCYYKGTEVLLDAARRIDAPIAVAGDGPWRRRLHAQARRLGLGEQVRFLGAVPEEELIGRMRASRVFVFPSTGRAEAFGIAQLKAMACGLPVVSSELPGVRWLNRDGETGICVPAGDAMALASAVNRLLRDEPLRTRLAEGARERAARFSVERMAADTEMVYEELGCSRV